jgi:hypothetical protein
MHRRHIPTFAAQVARVIATLTKLAGLPHELTALVGE